MNKEIMNQKKLILASKSPRRIELLKEMGLDFIVDPSGFNEKNEGLSAEELVKFNALGKAESIKHKYENALIMGVDTIGAVRERILNKPKTREEAKEMLRLLSGSKHKVLSAICVIDTFTAKTIIELETTYVFMEVISEAEMENYLDSKEGRDKAAGYAIQGLGALFVKKIEGDYFNVVGLPIYRMKEVLKIFDYRII